MSTPYKIRDSLLYSSCVRCGRPIKDPVLQYGKTNSSLVNVLCCSACLEEYQNTDSNGKEQKQ